ncbi:MAG: TonB-dependent receptor, partial [Pseudomonadales bacterium]|nr:TonB-dependent receptor [Pseudomonadales bacterium]
YNLVDARASYQINEELQIGAAVKNIFGNDYTLVSSGFQQFRTEGQTASVYIAYQPR